MFAGQMAGPCHGILLSGIKKPVVDLSLKGIMLSDRRHSKRLYAVLIYITFLK